MAAKKSSVAFVRKEPLPAMPPPARDRGAAKWIRENLLSNISNSVLTVLSIIAIYYLCAFVLPWIWNGVWTTSSLAECREVLQGVTGGCFSVLTERWNQLIFGFAYPSEFYWRPALAFVLLFFAAAPVLFFDLPRKLLIFTGLYPFLAFWLIWGGPIGYPLIGLLGCAVGYFVHSVLVARNFALGLIVGFAAAIATWSLGSNLVGALAPEQPLLGAVESRKMGGFMLNMILGTVAVSLALPIGIALALGRQSRLPIVKWVCVVFIEFIRGVPLITLLFVANVVLAYFFPPEANIDILIRVIIMLTIFSAAYIAEVIRGGLAALPRGQYEAADSLGLDYAQAMQMIVLPQALKISIPGIVNVAVGLFKDTTLVSIISMFDLVGMIRGPILASTEWNGVYWELLGFAAVLFFIVCYGISQYSQWLERRLATDHR
ncbi:MAG: amino acid ABC transporter permease [Pseudomonadota bacterium]